MNRLVFCFLFAMIALSSAQYGNNPNQYGNQQPGQNYPNQYGNQQPGQMYPSLPSNPIFPKIDCSQPGANCHSTSRFAEESSYSDDKGTTKYTRVCDDKGCYDRKVYSGSSGLKTTTSLVLVSLCAVVAAFKLIF